MNCQLLHELALPWVAAGLALLLAAAAEATALPDEFQPEAVRTALRSHLDAEVLPYLTSPEREAGRPSWADVSGWQIIRVLRTLFVHAVAAERTDDPATRERIRAQYDRHFARLAGFRDATDGLWVTATRYDGGGALDGAKTTTSQAYLIYTMSELALRVSDSRARKLALETFSAMDARAHDAQCGGYFERADLPADNPANASKQLGTNMNAAIALTRLFRIAPSKVLRERLEELLAILTEHALAPESGNVPLRYSRDWRILTLDEDPQQLVLYAMSAEVGWHMLEVARALGKDEAEVAPWFLQVVGGIIANGIGPDGRVYSAGPVVGPATDPDSVAWWTHTEVAVMLARAYRLTGDARYWALFERVLRFTFAHFVPDSSGAWLAAVNLADGSTSDGSEDPWFAGHHIVRMLLECDRALGELTLPPVVNHHEPLSAMRATQIETGFAYYHDRSAESIAAELKANGFECVHLICLSDTIAPPDLIDELHKAGLQVWGTFFPTGVYMPTRLFPPEQEQWRMQFTSPAMDAYRFYSYVHPGYAKWWQQHLASLYAAHKLDGMVWYEVHYPTQQGMTAWGDPCFGDVSPGFVSAFKRATGRSDCPSFTDPASPDYYRTDRDLYLDYVEFRVNSVMAFQREVLDGEGGLRRTFPQLPFASWTISIRNEGGLEALRENEAQDPARVVVELRPDMHYFQSHAPDWSKESLGPDYVEGYAPYVEAVRAVAPELPLAVQGDVGSTLPWRRDPAWMRGFEEACHRLGAGSTTYYEFSLRWEVYLQAPRVAWATVDDQGHGVIAFDKRIAAGVGAQLEGRSLGGGRALRDVTVDGNLLRFCVEGDLSTGEAIEVPLAGITDDPAVRYPLVGRPEAEAQGPVNTIPEGTTATLRRI